MRLLAAALVLAAAAPAFAGPSGEELWDAGRRAAAAAAFEQRWKETKAGKDGLNAVIAYRAVGRYAHARVLLVDVRKQTKLDDELTKTAVQLDQRLTEITAWLRVPAEAADAVIKVDGNVAPRIGNRVILDPGGREISMELPRCERFAEQVEALPSTEVKLQKSLACDHTGRVHLVFLDERDAALRIDGVARQAGAGELDLALEPGPHRVEVDSPTGPLFDEQIDVTTGAVVTRPVAYPWRSSGGLWFLATSGSLHAGTPGSSGFVGAGIGRASHRGRWYFDLGMGRQPDGLSVGASAGLELTRHVLRPLWRAHAARAWWHAVVEPASVWVRQMSRLGPPVVAFDGSAGVAQDVTTLHVGSVGLTVDAASWHGEVMVWPVGAFVRHADRTDVGYGVAASLMLGFRL